MGCLCVSGGASGEPGVAASDRPRRLSHLLHGECYATGASRVSGAKPNFARPFARLISCQNFRHNGHCSPKQFPDFLRPDKRAVLKCEPETKK
jgi:hypothetical protein